VTEYHRRPTWVALFLKRKNGAVMKPNAILSVHRAGILFCALVLQGVNV